MEDLYILNILTAAGLAQLVERLTAEREVVGSIPGTGGRISPVVERLTAEREVAGSIPGTGGRISPVGRAPDCRAGGRGFDSRDRTNVLSRTQGFKIAEN